MTISLSTVYVLVDDPEAALTFYRDTLGLSVGNDVSNEGFRWVTLTFAEQPGLEIVLTHPRAGRSEADGQAIATLLAKGELGAIQLRSDDLEATFNAVAAAPGVEILEEPTDQFWGVRDMALRDPAGNIVRIRQA